MIHLLSAPILTKQQSWSLSAPTSWARECGPAIIMIMNYIYFYIIPYKVSAAQLTPPLSNGSDSHYNIDSQVKKLQKNLQKLPPSGKSNFSHPPLTHTELRSASSVTMCSGADNLVQTMCPGADDLSRLDALMILSRYDVLMIMSTPDFFSGIKWLHCGFLSNLTSFTSDATTWPLQRCDPSLHQSDYF